jgi:diaminopimelate epimerase
MYSIIALQTRQPGLFMTDTPAFNTAPEGRFFIKMHGLYNHFVITDGRQTAYQPDDEEIIRICHPQTGVGADQLIIIEPPTAAGREAGATAFMRILNVDAREVEACGNATRCVAWLLLEEAAADEVIVETLAGMLACKRTGQLEVNCTMGRVTGDWQKIPLSRAIDTANVNLNSDLPADGIALNIGNPHIVFFVDDINAVDLQSIGPRIQANALFPQQVNVGIAEIVNNSELRSRVFERGAGLTTACGSGACAAAYAAIERGLTDRRRMTVHMQAGDVVVDIAADGLATMTGPVAYCFSGFVQ